MSTTATRPRRRPATQDAEAEGLPDAAAYATAPLSSDRLPPELEARYLELSRRASGLGRARRVWGPESLLVIGAVATGLGFLLVVLGWLGASRTIYVFEQLPYLISGGLLGGCLVVAGGLCYFGSWVARSAVQQTRQAEALERMEGLLRELVERSSR